MQLPQPLRPNEIESARRSHRSAGFTLIELIAVMVLTAILAGVAVPTLSSLGDSRQAFVTRMLQRDMTFARQRAVATGTNTWVVFDVGSESWTVLEEDASTPGRADAEILDDPLTGHPFSIDVDETVFAGVNIVSASFDGGSEVGFDWLGRPLADDEDALAADGVVTIGDGFAINVTAGTGHITMDEP